MFLFGISLTGGQGRLNTGKSNKYISIGDGGIIIPGTNLYIDGTEVIVNEETLSINGLENTIIECNEEQKMWLLAGLIAGIYQPRKFPTKWAYLTFIVDEETIIKVPEDVEIFESNSNGNYPSQMEVPNDSSNLPSADSGSGSQYGSLFDGDTKYVEPDDNGNVTLMPGVEYIIAGGASGVSLPTNNSRPVQSSVTEIKPSLEHTLEDYIDDNGDEMTKIVVPLGNNKIIIYFKSSDKSEDGSWYRVGANITIEAVPSTGWDFVQWTIDESLIVTDIKYSFIVEYDSTFRAKFRQIGASAMDGYSVISKNDPAHPDYSGGDIVIYVVNITVSPDSTDTGVVSGAGTYNDGDTVTLYAMPTNDTSVIEWFKDGELLGTGNTLDIVVTEDVVYEVKFTLVDYNGLVASFDALKNNGSEFDISTTIWHNLLIKYPIIDTTDDGFVSNGLVASFDAIENTGSDFDSEAAEWVDKI